MTDISTESVKFYSAGNKLAGDLYLPTADSQIPRPAVVILHGWTGIKNFLVGDIATKFAHAGYVALTFDYRGYGESDGTRHRLIPEEQVEDGRNAITFLSTLEQVSETQIGAVGVSFGGGIGLAIAARDKRLRCLSCNGTVSNGENWLRSVRREWEWIAFKADLEEDRRLRVQTGESKRVTPWEILVPPPDPTNFIENNDKNIPGFKSTLPLESADAVIEFKPVQVADQIRCPVRLIHAETDPLVPSEQSIEVHSALQASKSLVLIPVAARMELYQRHFETVINHHLDWHLQHNPLQPEICEE